MALHPCRECTKDVAQGAPTCPHCGMKNPAPKPLWKRPIGILLGLLVVLWAVGKFSGSDADSTTSGTPVDAAASVPVGPPPSPWNFSSSTSEMDDKPINTLALAASERVQNWIDRVTPELYIRCTGTKLDAFIVTETAADVESGHLDQARVTVRVDSAQATTGWWTESTDDKAFFAPGPARLVRSLLGANRLLIGYTPFNASPVVARFDLADVDSQLTRLPSGCL